MNLCSYFFFICETGSPIYWVMPQIIAPVRTKQRQGLGARSSVPTSHVTGTNPTSGSPTAACQGLQRQKAGIRNGRQESDPGPRWGREVSTFSNSRPSTPLSRRFISYFPMNIQMHPHTFFNIVLDLIPQLLISKKCIYMEFTQILYLLFICKHMTM